MNKLINSINQLEEVKKYKRLEKIVDSNEDYKKKIDKLFEYQKQMINSKYYELENNFIIFEEKYIKLKKEIENDVTINMFLECMEEINLLLEDVTSIISNVINKEFMEG